MIKKIVLSETQLKKIVEKLTNPSFSVVDEPLLGSTDSYIHTGVKQADDAKDSEVHVVDDNQADVEHGPDAMFEMDAEMPEEWMDQLEDETGVQRPMGYPEDLPDIEYSSAPAPTKTPVRTPTKTPTPTRPKRQDPFKVPDIKPGEEPAPKANKEMETISMTESELINMIENLVRETKSGNN